MSTLKNDQFKTLNANEMSSIQGGWKLFGKETVKGDVHGSIAGNYYSTDSTTTTYVFGIHGSGTTTQVTDGYDPAN